MKKLVVMLVAMAVMGCGSAFALTEDLTISAGVKSWYNWYNPPPLSIGGVHEETSAAFMIGPTIKLQYKNLYMGVTYLTSANEYEPVDGTTTDGFDLNLEVSRDDLDIVFGYMLSPRLSVNVGYKGIYTESDATVAYGGLSASDALDASYHMAAVGVGGNTPISTRGILFMNINGLAGKYSDDSDDEDEDVWGGSAELGAVFSLVTNLTANAGFKYQYLDVGGEGVSFYGPTLGLDYRF